MLSNNKSITNYKFFKLSLYSETEEITSSVYKLYIMFMRVKVYIKLFNSCKM